MQPTTENKCEPKGIDWALKEFRIFDGNYKREAVDVAVRNQAEITPKLLAILEDVLAHPEKYLPPEHNHVDGECVGEHENIWSHIYAVTLLAHFKENRAHSLIAKVFSFPEEIVDGLFADMITEDLPALLYATYPGSPDTIKALMSDESAYEYCRASAGDALAYCVASGLLDRKDVLDYLATFFDEKAVDRNFEITSHLACTMLDLYPNEHMDVIYRGFSSGLILKEVVDEGCFKDDLKKLSPEKCLQKIRDDMKRRVPSDPHGRLESWACFKENSMEMVGDDYSGLFEVDEPFVRENEKTGRNDPCPCGSGKKFKKCCLH